MADTVTSKWIYPPNFDGYYPNDKVGHRRHTIKFLCSSDGTGETAVHKVVRQDLKTSSGNIPSKLVLEKIDYTIHGIGVTIAFDTTPDEPVAILNAGVGTDSNSGCFDYRDVGGITAQNEGGTGDIIFTTANATSGDSYDITLTVRLKD